MNLSKMSNDNGIEHNEKCLNKVRKYNKRKSEKEMKREREKKGEKY